MVAVALLAVAAWSSAPAAASHGEARAVLGRAAPITVSVLGDSTGNEDGEWVDLWARRLGQSRTVVLHQWDDGRGGWLPTVRVYGSGGPQVTIWNGSKSGAQAGYALDRLGLIQPVRPDLVVYSFGHNHWPGNVVGPLRSLTSAVDRRWPVPPAALVVLQNPELGERAPTHARVEDEVSRWAGEAGLPTVDVFAAFRSRPDEARLLKDFHHPSAAGSAVWAQVVEEALSPER